MGRRQHSPRVIAGLHRGRRLSMPRGDIRPTSDRVKESLFGILTPYVRDARVLDLCAGTGALGIEALSRGAREAVLVESARPCVATIRRNLSELGLAERAEVVAGDAVQALLDLAAEGGRAFDIILADPPYAGDTGRRLLAALAGHAGLLAEGGVAAFEHAGDLLAEGEEAARGAVNTLSVLSERRYGDTHITLFQRARCSCQ